MYDEMGNFIGDPSLGDFNTGGADATPVDATSGSVDPFGGGDLSQLGNIGNILPVVYTGSGNVGGVQPALGIVPRVGAVGAGRVAGRAVGALWGLAQRFGPQLVAGVVGMSAEQLMAVFLDRKPWRHRRRRRGISARDMRTTRRVVRFVNRMQHDIGCVHRPAYRRGRH